MTHQPAYVSFVLISGFSLLLTGCMSTVQTTTITYLPLGDSYTIGEGVATTERWPNQLVSQLANQLPLVMVDNPARTGYTSEDLINTELPLVATVQPDFVTIQIGVNDWVQGVPAETFREHFTTILETVLKTVPADHMIVVTIPDYTVTPTGKLFGDAATNQAGIEQFNEIIATTAAAYHITVVDIYALSQAMGTDPSLVVADGLHPSSAEYRLWVDLIYPPALEQLQ